MFFLHYNAPPPPYSSEFTSAFLDKIGWFIFPYLAYPLDLAPSDFWLFHLKDFLGGQHFANELQVKQTVAKFFRDCPISFYATGIEHLVVRYKKCLNFDSDYVEK